MNFAVTFKVVTMPIKNKLDAYRRVNSFRRLKEEAQIRRHLFTITDTEDVSL